MIELAARRMWVLPVLLCLFVLALAAPALCQTDPPVTIVLGTEKTSYGPTEAIPMRIRVMNASGAEVLVNRGFSTQPFHLALRIRDPQGAWVSLVHDVVAPEPGPPFRFDGKSLVPLEAIPAGYDSTTGMDDARAYYKFGENYGWYTAQVQVPLEAYPAAALFLYGNPFGDLADPGRKAYNPLSSNPVRFEIRAPVPVVTSALHVALELLTVGPGSKPETRKSPMGSVPVRVYLMAGIPAGFQPVSWKVYPAIWGGVEPLKSGLTDAAGIARFSNMERGDYLVLAQSPVAEDSPYVGGRVEASDTDWAAGAVILKKLNVLQKTDGKKVPGKTTKLKGSLLLITEPEYVEWSGSQELYPFVFETEGDWSVTTAVAPPEGFVADYKELGAQVVDQLKAVQFTVTDVGSKWVETAVTHKIKHKYKSYKVDSKIGVKLTRALAKEKKKTVFGDTEAPGPFEAGRKVKDEEDKDKAK